MGGQACVFYGTAEFSRSNAALCRPLVAARPLLTYAAARAVAGLERALHDEEAAERERDKLYWLPLRRELEALRRGTERVSNG